MEEEKLLKQLIKYSKHKNENAFYLGEKQANFIQKILKKEAHYNERYTEFGGLSLDGLKKKINNYAEKLGEFPDFSELINGTADNPDSGLRNVGFLKGEFLDRCRGKELKRICKLLSKINLFVERYKSKEKKLSSPNAQPVKDKYRQAIQCYKEVLESGNTSLLDLEKLETFDTDAFAKALDQSYKDFSGEDELKPSNLDRSSIRDLEVVRALEFTGISLKRGKDKSGEIKWEIDTEATNYNGIAYTDKDNNVAHFKLPSEQIESFLDNYLNIPENERKGVITPEGIFKLYLEESTKNLNPFMGRVFGFGKDNKTINEQIEANKKKYSVNSPEWQTFAKGSERMAIADASKLALVDLFMGHLSKKHEIVSETLQTTIQVNDLVDDRWVNKFLETADRFNDLSDSQRSSADGFNDLSDIQISDGYGPANDIVKKYLTAKKDVEARLRNSHLKDEERENLENSLKEIEKSIATLNLVREFELKFVEKALESQNLQGEALRDKYVEIINNLSECDFLNVQENEPGKYELFVNEDIKTLPENIQSLCNAIVKEVNDLSVKSSEQPEKDIDSSTTAAEVAQSEDLSAQDEAEDDYERLFYDVLENAFISPNKLILGDNLEKFAIFNRTEALTSNGKDNELVRLLKVFRELKEQNPDTSLEKFIQEESDKFGFDKDPDNALFTRETLSIVEGLTSNDPKAYQQAQQDKEKLKEEAIKSVIFAERILKNFKEQNISANDINKDMFSKAFSEMVADNKGELKPSPTAEERSEAVKKLEDYQKISDKHALTTTVNENGELTNQFKDYYTNKYRSQSSQNTNDNSQDNSAENNEDNTTKIKFSDKYPKKDETALLKKFKPYCAKSTGKIIDNLLKMIQGIEITIKDPSKLSSVNVTHTDDGKNSNKDNNQNPTDRNVDDGKGTGEVKSDDGNSSHGQEDEKSSDRPVEEQDQEKNSEPEEEKSETNDGKTKDESEPEKSEEEKAKEQTEAEEQKNDEKTSKEEEIHNNIGISDRQFATYRMLAVGLQAILKTPPFEKSRKLLNGEEKSKLDSLSKVLNYIVSEPKDPKNKEEADFKKWLADEIDYKSSSTEKEFFTLGSRTDHIDFFKGNFPNYASELVNDINNVLFNMKNLEELGAIIGITTDRSEKNPEMGNKLTDEDVEKILKSRDELELWEFIKSNNNAKTGLCETPVVLSSELTKIIENEIKDSQNNQDCDMGML